MTKVRAAFAWFTAEQWPEYRRIMVDETDMTHAQWLQNAMRLEKRLKKDGVDVHRVMIDLSEFDLWCAIHKRPRDSQARSDYAAEMLDKLNPA